MHAYRLKNTGASSDKYGCCEVCGKPASTIFHLTGMRRYTRHDGSESLTFHNCPDAFGHKECLSAITEKN